MPLKPRLSLLTALAACLCVAIAANAQTASPAKPSAKAAKAAAKKSVPPAPAEVPLAAAGGEQIAAAALALYGEYACEFDQSLVVSTTPGHDGYVDVRFKAQTWTMLPVLSSTGALRLEDVKGRMLLIQIANKSMLMDTQLGHRVVDGCMHEKQRLANAAAQPASEALLQVAAPAASPAR
jgi:hypothetical protein